MIVPGCTCGLHNTVPSAMARVPDGNKMAKCALNRRGRLSKKDGLKILRTVRQEEEDFARRVSERPREATPCTTPS